MWKVFVDGGAGTTGLRIADRLRERRDVELVILPEERRKDISARRDALNGADAAFLCLPDDAAREAAALAENERTVVIDTSTAHRTAEGWAYGFSEIGDWKEKIRKSHRIANPGCHATGFIALAAPLVETGVIGRDAHLSCFSLTGYSGGGKKMIAEYESEGRSPLLSAPRQYGLGQSHKHLPEMRIICGLENAPIFCPVVAPYYAGMEVTVPLFREDLSCGPEKIREIYRDYYGGGLVRYAEGDGEGGFLSACSMAGRDDLTVSVLGNEERILLVSRFDNLGKGASGAAIQNMNLALGADEFAGLMVGNNE